MGPLGSIFWLIIALVASILIIIFVLVPLLKGVGWAIGALFKGVGWTVMHIFEFIGGMISDAIRSVGAIIAMGLLALFVPLNIIIGRWSAAGHFALSVKRECKVFGLCLYRILLRRPLKLFWLHGLLEGLEQRVPEALAAAPGSDRPSRRLGEFEGYTIVGSLPGGGSGAKLYIAEPTEVRRAKQPDLPALVVIKSFMLSEGSSLPQIVRESRALEAAKQLGLVLEHGMDEHRFFYIMPYHAGEHLGVVTRQLHGETDGRGLEGPQLGRAVHYVSDLVRTLSGYHRGGLWHKDVKPENVIVHDGRAHLVDLGLVTPLRSAMTLTTHGTEYFRDPEMVRMALRGVKVHQVNGAKFDIFAAGAVLYFVIENTFPAHGALSRFNRKSPEALRWIVRRAMADYHQRYESADEMLGDLRCVAQADDPYTVKPVDLPSMGGRAVELDNAPDQPDVDYVLVGHSATPPADAPRDDDDAFKVYGVAAGLGAKGPFARVGKVDLDDRGNPVDAPRPAFRRPKLRVTNWWTGAYVVDDPGTDAEIPAAPISDVEQFRAQATAARHEAQMRERDEARLREDVLAGRMSPRRAAHVQRRDARQRARQIRKQAHERRMNLRRPERMSHPGNSAALYVVGAMTLLLLLGGVALGLLVMGNFNAKKRSMPVTVSSSNPNTYVAMPFHATALAGDPGNPPVQVYYDMTDSARDRMRDEIQDTLEDFADQDYYIVNDRSAKGREINSVFRQWNQDKTDDVDHHLEDLLEELNLYGILHLSADGHDNVSGIVVFSERRGANNRRYVIAEPETIYAFDQPVLLINDHPLKNDPHVEQAIDAIIRNNRLSGLQFVLDPGIEGAVRTILPMDVIDGTSPVPTRLATVLDANELAGVFLISSPHRADATAQDIAVRLIERGEIDVPQAPPSPPSVEGDPDDEAPVLEELDKATSATRDERAVNLCIFGSMSNN
jgi:serine/threonine protein kinase